MIPKLDSSQFTYARYNAGGWVDLGYGFADRCNINIYRENVKKYAIGYCDATSLPFRQREGKAIMFDIDDGGEWFWLHLEQWEFEKIFEEDNQ